MIIIELMHHDFFLEVYHVVQLPYWHSFPPLNLYPYIFVLLLDKKL